MSVAAAPERELELQLKDLIVAKCRVTEPVPDSVSYDAPLIGPDSPFGLDSLDAVELVVAIQKAYAVRIGSQDVSRQALTSLRTLADCVRRQTAARGSTGAAIALPPASR